MVHARCLTVLAVLTGLLVTPGLGSSGSSEARQGQQLTQKSSDTFNEEVDLHVLSNSHYQLTYKAQQGSWLGAHQSTTFPRAILNLAAASPLTHLSIHLTRGRWVCAVLILASLGSGYPAPSHKLTGVAQHNVRTCCPWTAGLSILGTTEIVGTSSWCSLLCASLNLAAHPSTASVDHMTEMHNTSARAHYVTALPREAVCTENMSPWLRLLPCRGAAGLAGLLSDKSQVLGGDHHTLSLELTVAPGSTADAPARLSLTLSFTCVLRLPPAAAAAPSALLELKRLLPACQHIIACSAASSSRVAWSTACGVSQLPHSGCGDVHVLDMLQVVDKPASQILSGTLMQRSLSDPTPPAVRLHTALHGSGLHTGQLVVVVEQLQAHRVSPAAQWPAGTRQSWAAGGARINGDSWGLVCVQQWVPWVLRVWLHTRVFHVDQQEVPAEHLVVWEQVEPAQDRGRPLQLSTCLRFPPAAQRISITTHTSRAFLTLAEHPPDAHRGWDLPPARLTYHDSAATCPTASAGGTGCPCIQQVLGPSVLVRLATADVAMPYNVICLTSTVLAISFGAALNIIMQRSKAGLS